MSNVLIESLGVYLPERAVSTEEIVASCKNAIRYPVERLTGIESRRMAGEHEFSIDLARHAISRCFDLSKYGPADIDLVICANISRYDKPGSVSFEPSTAVQLKRDFGLDNALCFDVSNACAGMFTAIHIVDGFIKSGLAKRALVVSGEYISHLAETAQKELSDSKDDLRLACLTLGDSGAAVILEESPYEGIGFHDIEMFTLGKYSDLCVAQPTRHNHGGYIMNTQSVKMHHIGIPESVKFMASKLKSLGRRGCIDHFLFHQTARSAIQKYGEGINRWLGMHLCGSHNNINNLKHRGNTSSTAHFVALWDKIHDRTIHSKDTVFFGIQASGITLGVAHYTFDDLPDRIRNQEKPRRHRNSETAESGEQPPTRIAIGSLGTALHGGDGAADSIALATTAVRSCLEQHRCAPQDVGLLVNTGVYRNDFISEPAVAAIIAGEGRLNAGGDDWHTTRTFAYDLGNGACGFLHACQNAQAMIRSGKTKKALCVSSEIENNRTRARGAIIGLKEGGCAALLEESTEAGFLRFLFKHYPDYQEAFHTEMRNEDGEPFLRVSREQDLAPVILGHISSVIEELFDAEGLSMDDIRVIMPPQISGAFVSAFSSRLNLPESKVVNLHDDQNYYTCSTVFAVKHAVEAGMAQPGDIALILEAGAGLQIAAALYQF